MAVPADRLESGTIWGRRCAGGRDWPGGVLCVGVLA